MGVKKEEQGGLLDFNWEGDGDDFFGITDTEEKEVVEIIEDKKEEEEEKEPKKEVKAEKEEDLEFETFGDSAKEDTSEKGTKKTSKVDEGIYSDYYKDLKEKGILKHVELEEGEEITPDKLFELQEKDIEQEISSRLKNWANEELDDDAREFIKFKRDGGSTSDFFAAYSKSSGTPSGGDIDNEDYQDKVIRHQLKEESWDAEEIEDRLRYLTDSGKKKAAAKRYNKKIEERNDQTKAKALKQAEANKQAALKQEQDFKHDLKNVLDVTKDISGVKVTEKDKTQLYNFLTKRSHKISDTKSVTGFQKKLGEAFQDTNKMLLLAKLVNSDFDLSAFEKATITKKTKEIKSNIEQRRNMRPNNSGSSLEGNSLADLFN
jgi:hypothetical protein